MGEFTVVRSITSPAGREGIEMRNNIAIRDYSQRRFAHGIFDDRCDKTKLQNDALLRGQIGITLANKMIKSIDEIKSYR